MNNQPTNLNEHQQEMLDRIIRELWHAQGELDALQFGIEDALLAEAYELLVKARSRLRKKQLDVSSPFGFLFK